MLLPPIAHAVLILPTQSPRGYLMGGVMGRFANLAPHRAGRRPSTRTPMEVSLDECCATVRGDLHFRPIVHFISGVVSLAQGSWQREPGKRGAATGPLGRVGRVAWQ